MKNNVTKIIMVILFIFIIVGIFAYIINQNDSTKTEISAEIEDAEENVENSTNIDTNQTENYFDTTINNYFINRYDGTSTEAADYYCSDFIPFTSGISYQITAYKQPENLYDCVIAYYYEDKSFKGYDLNDMVDEIITSNSDTDAYIRVISYNSEPIIKTVK